MSYDTTRIDDEGGAAPKAPVTVADAPALASRDATPSNDLDGLLAQWDREVGSGATEPAAPTITFESIFEEHDRATEEQQLQVQIDGLLKGDAQKRAADAMRLSDEIEQLRQGGAQAQQRAEQLERVLGEVQQREWLRGEQEEFSKLVKEAETAIGEFKYLPEGFAERWLLAEALKDDQLRAAWDHRNDLRIPEQIRGRMNSYVRETIKKCYKAAASVPDREATEDRAAVAAAVRGAGGRVAEEPAPKLGNLTDKEFAEYKEGLGL